MKVSTRLVLSAEHSWLIRSKAAAHRVELRDAGSLPCVHVVTRKVDKRIYSIYNITFNG
jgi:hypothetical protein